MIVIDTETTGLTISEPANLYSQPHVTEIALCRVRKVKKKIEVVDKFTSLIKPPILIPPEITKFTHIDNDMVKNSPSFVEVVDKVIDFFLASTDVLGANINFDMDVLRYELRRLDLEYNFPWPRNRHDIIEMSYPIKNKRMRLGQIHEHLFGYEFDGAHRAEQDAMITAKCYYRLKKKGF